ncbi:MAG: hypothetical protein ACI4WR_06050 [Bulleidia sp.]
MNDGRFRHIARDKEFMNQQNYPETAKICVTHPYAWKIDVSDEEEPHDSDLLSAITDDAYDRLIQLSDAISVQSRWILAEEQQEGLARE